MADKFEFNEATFRAIANEVADTLCKAEAEKVAARARASAPVVSGTYRDSIRVEVRSNPYSKAGTRMAVVESATDHTFAVEAHTGNLARALG